MRAKLSSRPFRHALLLLVGAASIIFGVLEIAGVSTTARVSAKGPAPVPAMLTGPGSWSSCSTAALAGKWIFATDVGHQSLASFAPYTGDITAIGTSDIQPDGSMSGVFDFTVADLVFVPNVTYTGSVTVSPDCRGTATFETSAGTTRTDSFVVVSRNEILGMSQDPKNLWTYQLRRISY